MSTKAKIQGILMNCSQKSVIGWSVEESDFEHVAEEIIKKIGLYNVGNSNDKKISEFDAWLKKQKLTEVITKEYKWRDFILDEEFVLAKYNQDKQN